jgi:hypothetical protein
MKRLAGVVVLLVNGIAGAQEVKHLRALPAPEGFAGHLAYDSGAKRLWLISYGPPANKLGPSKVMELDPATGRVLAEAELPLLGGFGPPVAAGGFLYQPVNFESRIYKIALKDRSQLGRIEGTIPIPQVSDLRPGGSAPGREPLKFPWLEVSGIAAAPDGNLLLYAADLGEFITLDRDTGKVLKRAGTMKGLGGIASVTGPGGKFYVLANMDPDDAAARDKARRFDLRAPEVVPWKRSKVTLFSHRPDRKIVMWILLDGESGEPLASVEDDPSPAFASGAVVSDFRPGGGDVYGRFTFFAMGPAGVLTMRWSPALGSK